MAVEVIIAIVVTLLALGLELLCWDMEWLWHKTEPKRDPRNMRPPF